MDRARVTGALASWRKLWPECRILRVYAIDTGDWSFFQRPEPCDPGPARPAAGLFDTCYWARDKSQGVVFTRSQGAVSASWTRGRKVERFEDAGFRARLRDQFGIRDLDGIHYWLTDRTADLYVWGTKLPDLSRAREIAARYGAPNSLGTTVHFGSRPRFPGVEFPCDNPGIAGTPVFEFDPRANRTIRCVAIAGRPPECRESVAAGGVWETGTPPVRSRLPPLRREM